MVPAPLFHAAGGGGAKFLGFMRGESRAHAQLSGKNLPFSPAETNQAARILPVGETLKKSKLNL
jgi:hypothetical protein